MSTYKNKQKKSALSLTRKRLFFYSAANSSQICLSIKWCWLFLVRWNKWNLPLIVIGHNIDKKKNRFDSEVPFYSPFSHVQVYYCSAMSLCHVSWTCIIYRLNGLTFVSRGLAEKLCCIIHLVCSLEQRFPALSDILFSEQPVSRGVAIARLISQCKHLTTVMSIWEG